MVRHATDLMTFLINVQAIPWLFRNNLLDDNYENFTLFIFIIFMYLL